MTETRTTTGDAAGEKVHVFERAGLGRGPFRCVGVVTKRGPLALPGGGFVGAPGQPMGACRFCGTGIAECYQITSADGRRFEVGSECVKKTGDAGLRRVVAEHERIKNAAARERSNGKADERIARVREWFETPAASSVRDALAARPHPNAYYAEREGRSALDAVRFMWANAGRTGKLATARQIEKLAAELGAVIA